MQSEAHGVTDGGRHGALAEFDVLWITAGPLSPRCGDDFLPTFHEAADGALAHFILGLPDYLDWTWRNVRHPREAR